MKKLFSVRTIILSASLLLQLSPLCFQSRGGAGDVDLSFDAGSGIGAFVGNDGLVNAFVVQPDGKMIIGGQFFTVKGLKRIGIARLNADGSGDATFRLAEVGFVSDVALQPDGKVLVGTDFGRVYRLNSDGIPDTNFNANAYGAVYSVAVQSDGKVVIGGYWLARLNADGSRDNSFNPDTSQSPFVGDVIVQPDGKLLATLISGLVRFNTDGSLDGTFNLDTGYVITFALQPDGKIIIGGTFTAVNGTNRNHIARLNADGSLDTSFNPGSGADLLVSSVALQPDGKVLIGGDFTTVNGTNRNRIARLNSNGALDSSFNPGTGADNRANSIAVLSDDKVVIGEPFTTVNGTNRNSMARLNADGSLDASFQPGRGASGDLVGVQPDGKVLVGSTRLNPDGSFDSSYIPPTNSPVFFPVTAYIPGFPDYTEETCRATQPDGKVLIGGKSYYSYVEPIDDVIVSWTEYFIFRFNANGSPDATFQYAIGPVDYTMRESVQALAVQPDGKVVVGGTFYSMQGMNRNGIARLNPDGSLDNSFDPGTGAYGVNFIRVQPDGKVFIAGGDGPFNYIARLNANGSLDSGFDIGTGVNGAVHSLAVQPDGKLLLGGDFTTLNGTNRNRIARLNSNGGLDSGFNPGTGTDGRVSAIVLQSDGNVLIGGWFTTVNGVLRPHVARLFGDFGAPPPSLNITRVNASVLLSWPTNTLNFQLQENTNVSLPNAWSPVAQSAVTNAGQISVSVPTSVGSRFFRLQSQ